MHKRDSGVALQVKHALSYQKSGIRNQDSLGGGMANQKSPEYEIQEVDSMIEMESLIEDGMFSVASMDPKTSSFELTEKELAAKPSAVIKKYFRAAASIPPDIRHLQPEMGEDKLPTPFNRSSDS
jgi:hypothetical protein